MQVANPITDLALRFCASLRTRFSAQLAASGAAFGRASRLEYLVGITYLQHCFTSAVESLANIILSRAPHLVLTGIDCDVDALDPTVARVVLTHRVQSSLG